MAYSTELKINNLLCFLFTAKKDYNYETLLDIIGTFYSIEDIKDAKEKLSCDINQSITTRRDPDRKIKEIKDLLELFDSFLLADLNIKYTADNYKKLPPHGMEFLAPMLATLNEEISKINATLPKFVDIKTCVMNTADTVRQLKIDLMKIDSKFNDAVVGMVEAANDMSEQKEENVLENMKSFKNPPTLTHSPITPSAPPFLPESPVIEVKSYSEVTRNSTDYRNSTTGQGIINKTNERVLYNTKSQRKHPHASPRFRAQEAFNGSNGGMTINRRTNSSFDHLNGVDNSLDSAAFSLQRNSVKHDDDVGFTMVEQKRRGVRRDDKFVSIRKRQNNNIYGTRKEDSNGFKAAKRFSALFIGKVDTSVHIDSIKTYIENTFKVNINVIEKLEIKADRHNAFKVEIEACDFDRLYDSEMWPENIIVRKFYNRRVTFNSQ